MKHRIIVVGICVGAWLCGSVQGQTTVVTNLIVLGAQQQGTNAIAAGARSTAQGEGTKAYGIYSHAEGQGSVATGSISHAEGYLTVAAGTASHAEGSTTVATGLQSHAEGYWTVAGGSQSHAEGLATEALAVNSHAGGAYARVRSQDSNSLIHATGTSTNMKATQYPDTAHFDHLVMLSPALNATNAVLSRAENDSRYATSAQGARADASLQSGSIVTVAAVCVIGNTIRDPGSAVAGGSNNTARLNAFVGGGANNMATGLYSFVGGGQYNYGRADYSAVAGGYANIAYSPYSAILGGRYNYASGECSVVVGGYNNMVLSNTYSQYSGIVIGYKNSIDRGSYSLIGGGYQNRMCYTGLGPASMFIGGGYTNFTGAQFAVIPGGYANVVTGRYGFAAGSYANAGHQSAFVWSDSSSTNQFSSTSSNQFLIRATGGVGINTNAAGGNALAVAGNVQVTGSGRFAAGIRVPQQGDISMGSYTNGTF